MLAEKDLVAKHIKAHENRDDLVVCGMFWKRIYSFYYDRFEKSIRKNSPNCMKSCRAIKRRSLMKVTSETEVFSTNALI